MHDLQGFVSEHAGALDVPGVAVGVLLDGVDHYAFHGITSVENPLDVDESTMFQFGSTGKTFTSTALLRLVEQGHFGLDTRVKELLPELRLKDRSVEERVITSFGKKKLCCMPSGSKMSSRMARS